MRVRQVVRHVSAGLDTPAGVTTFLWDEQGKTELPPWLSRDLEKEMHTHARPPCSSGMQQRAAAAAAWGLVWASRGLRNAAGPG
eukprot:125639-Pelagomonas_calceolata.AAC.1